MENKTREQDDQASELRKLIDEVESTQDEANQEEKRPQIQHLDAETDVKTERNIDILNLPPRKEVHSKTKKRTKLKLSNASKRLVTVTVLLIAVFVVMFYFWGDELLDVVRNM